MQKKLNKIAKDTNIFLKRFIKKQKKSELIVPMQYGLFSGGKKIRSKILVDVGSIFNLNYKTLLIIGAAVECIHAYSLIHDDLPCMDNDLIRRGKPSTHIKFGESTAVLAGNSLLTMAFEILSHKDLPNNYESSSLEELTLEANKIIEDLESKKDLQNSIEKYQNLIKLNNIIEKKFKKKVIDINTTTKNNISKITSKNNAKKTK